MNHIEETLRINKFSHYGIYAGMCAASGSFFGKILGFTGELTLNTVPFKALVIALMLISNAAVWTFFVKALHSSYNSLVPTITSAATNYICSAVAGYLFLGEISSLLWWCGTSFIISGLVLIVHGEKNVTKVAN